MLREDNGVEISESFALKLCLWLVFLASLASLVKTLFPCTMFFAWALLIPRFVALHAPEFCHVVRCNRLASVRSDTYWGNTIENRGCLYVYMFGRTYVILYFDLLVFFVLARCLTPSQTSLNGILRFSDHYPYHPKNWIVYRPELSVKT